MTTNISPASVKALREKTGAGMMDCKKALIETSGDVEEAIDWLRKKGLAAASKKAGRVASEGLVGVACAGNVAAIVEVNSETDFVGRNQEFQAFVGKLANLVIKNGDQDLLNMDYDSSQKVSDEVNRLISVIGENIQVRRAKQIIATNVTSSYIHSSVAPSLGRIGVLVALKSSADKNLLEDLGKKIAMHIAASNPIALNIADVPADLLEREKSILEEQANASGRPKDVIAKMIEGRIKKYYEEVVLTEQPYIMDGKTKVSDMLKNASKECGHEIEIESFVKFVLGEGIEKEEKDFASEVQACMVWLK